MTLHAPDLGIDEDCSEAVSTADPQEVPRGLGGFAIWQDKKYIVPEWICLMKTAAHVQMAYPSDDTYMGQFTDFMWSNQEAGTPCPNQSDPDTTTPLAYNNDGQIATVRGDRCPERAMCREGEHEDCRKKIRPLDRCWGHLVVHYFIKWFRKPDNECFELQSYSTTGQVLDIFTYPFRNKTERYNLKEELIRAITHVFRIFDLQQMDSFFTTQSRKATRTAVAVGAAAAAVGLTIGGASITSSIGSILTGYTAANAISLLNNHVTYMEGVGKTGGKHRLPLICMLHPINKFGFDSGAIMWNRLFEDKKSELASRGRGAAKGNVYRELMADDDVKRFIWDRSMYVKTHLESIFVGRSEISPMMYRGRGADGGGATAIEGGDPGAGNTGFDEEDFTDSEEEFFDSFPSFPPTRGTRVEPGGAGSWGRPLDADGDPELMQRTRRPLDADGNPELMQRTRRPLDADSVQRERMFADGGDPR